jgi:hypothetical protein
MDHRHMYTSGRVRLGRFGDEHALSARVWDDLSLDTERRMAKHTARFGVIVIVIVIAAMAVGACERRDRGRTEAAPSSPPDSTIANAASTALSPLDTSTPRSSDSGIGGCTRGSTPTSFDDRRGTYAAEVVDVDGRNLKFDVVQWLSGAAAAEEYERQHPGEGGPPNDYVIVNDNDRLRTAGAAPDATVLLVDLAGDGSPDLDPFTYEEFSVRQRPPGSTYWLTFQDGLIRTICEQYRP